VFNPLQRESKEVYEFSETHPGHEFSHLMKSKHKTVPRIALPTETVCPLKDLQLNTMKPTEESLEKREIYAKMALLMSILLGLWLTSPLKEAIGKKSQELQRHLEHKDTEFWHKGFDVLQNINDRMTLEKELKWAKDPNF
jgi:hypothetical protein